MNLPFAEGLKVERKLFGGLVTSPESAAQRYVFFAEREVWKIPDVPAEHADDPGGDGRHHRRRHDGRRHRDELRQRRHPGDHRRDPAGGARPRPRRGARQLRAQRPQRPLPDRGRRPAHGPDHRLAVARRPRRRRPRHRGRVRAHGHQEGRVHQARRDLQARRDPGDEHQRAEHRRDRLGHQPARGRDRPALLLAGQRDAAGRGRARRSHLEGGDQHLDADRQEDRQDRRARRRVPRLRRQPHARPARPRGAGAARRGRACRGTSTARSTTSASPWARSR